ncbi:MAG: hypothetical protein SF053_10785 [Bacteroidia bacterium]|nr:hypothetical protein [Bacteroidia bacterium]
MQRILILLALCPAILSAQTWQEKTAEMQRRIELRTQNQQNRVTAAQIRQSWSLYQAETAQMIPDRIEPVTPTNYDPATARVSLEPTEVEVASAAPASTARLAAPVTSGPTAPVPAALARGIQQLQGQSQTIFFGKSVPFRYDPAMIFRMSGPITSTTIATRWEQLENTQHELLIYQFTRQAEALRLNDWGFCQLVHAFARQTFGTDANARTLFTWFCLSKADIRCTVGYNAQNLHLLLAVNQTLYGRSFMRIQDQKYYITDLGGAPVSLDQAYIYEAQLSPAAKAVDMTLNVPPQLDSRTQVRTLTWTWGRRPYAIPVRVSPSLGQYYKAYPFTDLDVYLNAPASQGLHRLADTLRQIVRTLSPREGRSLEAEQVAFLLHMVQTAFPYQRDHTQFGQERYLFADESLIYPYTDCEDRAVLFAWLVREVLGHEVIALVYPGHVATAVSIPGGARGDYIRWQGRTWIICDPTYINAGIGMAMPETAGQKVKVVW